LYFPAFNVTEVPVDEPENDLGEGLFPDTDIVKSDGLLAPPLTFVVTVKNVFDPIGVDGVVPSVEVSPVVVSFLFFDAA
jgi:hypothetical protein